MTTTLAPEPKTTHPTSSPLPARLAGLEPAERIPAGPDAGDIATPETRIPAGPPALLVEHVTKRFNVGRRKPPVLAINDVSLRLERGARSTGSWAPTAPASRRSSASSPAC